MTSSKLEDPFLTTIDAWLAVVQQAGIVALLTNISMSRVMVRLMVQNSSTMPTERTGTKSSSRDIALLEKALETETNPGLIQRYPHLANTFYDMGEFVRAAEHYKIRMTLGGPRRRSGTPTCYAMCLRLMHDNIGSGRWRPISTGRGVRKSDELAKFFRERGDNHTSLLFSEPRLQYDRPPDLLSVNEWSTNMA